MFDFTMIYISYVKLESGIEGLVNTLQCPVCLETAHKPPIFQCPEGHLLCQDCNERVKEYPQCGKPLENARNRTAEELAEKLKVCIISYIELGIEILDFGQLFFGKGMFY